MIAGHHTYHVFIEDLQTHALITAETHALGERYAMDKVQDKYPPPRYNIYGIRKVERDWRIYNLETRKYVMKNRYEEMDFESMQEAERYMRRNGMEGLESLYIIKKGEGIPGCLRRKG